MNIRIYGWRALPLLLALCLLCIPLYSQDAGFDVSCSINWVSGELNAQTSYELAQAGIKLPTGRNLAEDILSDAYTALVRPFILSIAVDSSSTVEDLVNRGDLSLEDLDILFKESKRVPPSFSTDLSRITGRYTIEIGKISSLLIRHRRFQEPSRPLIRVEASNYTGIIIMADKELPVRGRRIQELIYPCLFPKIWDTDMNLIFERNMIQPDRQRGVSMVKYTSYETVFRPTPSGLDGDLAALVGANPLRIIAREAFGINPTDPVIDREDALKIISTENNRRLLREGRVILVLNEKTLSN